MTLGRTLLRACSKCFFLTSLASWDKMEEEIDDQIFYLSRKTKDEFVTPLILEYYQLEDFGMVEKDIMNYLERKYSKEDKP